MAHRINLRTPEVMNLVEAEVGSQYRSELVTRLRLCGGTLSASDLTVRLAKEFGFCYGVQRAIDLAYAAHRVFQGHRIYILGEIIHNPEVNEQLAMLGIENLLAPDRSDDIDRLGPEDVVIIPAFGAEVSRLEQIKARGCQIVDTTCGDVMRVWKRVRQYASESATSIILGRAQHEETRATSSRVLGDGHGHYVIVANLTDADYLCRYIRHGGDKAEFFERFHNAHSPGFDPDVHLQKLGVANQTTMLSSETEEIQRRIYRAVLDRDGEKLAGRNFQAFDCICGATQDRQNALLEIIAMPLDLLLVIGGYNSSNTAHLVEIGEARLPTYFIRNASRLQSPSAITHYDQRKRQEITTENWLPIGRITVGITAGASCPNNLIEEVIVRLFSLRGISCEQFTA